MNGDPNTKSLVEFARKQQFAGDDLQACWNLLVKGLECHVLDGDEVVELLDLLNKRWDYINDEISFEFIGDRLRVRFLGEKYFCSPKEFMVALERLINSLFILCKGQGMKLSYFSLAPEDQPITTIREYLELRQRYDGIRRRRYELAMMWKQLKKQGKELSPDLFEELRQLESQITPTMYALQRRTPFVLVSLCPYCKTEIWQAVGVFSLLDEFWYKSSSTGREVPKVSSHCPHLFCIDGALNLNNHQPTEQSQAILTKGATTIPMAAEVPFVKPRILNLPTMRAVIHRIPVAERYTAYPIVYFAERRPADHIHFCIPWASPAFDGMRPYANNREIGFTGTRSDQQDYDLTKWIEKGKLSWVDPETEAKLMDGPVEAFPYAHITGRRHPYYIENGIVHDLPDPVESAPKIILGDLVPPRF